MIDTLIRLSVATAHCAIGTSGVCATKIKETDKAVQFQSETHKGKFVTFWLPKKALKQEWHEDGTTCFSLAKWFHPTGWTLRAFELCERHHVSAA